MLPPKTDLKKIVQTEIEELVWQNIWSSLWKNMSKLITVYIWSKVARRTSDCFAVLKFKDSVENNIDTKVL